jgi:hypothetical protein
MLPMRRARSISMSRPLMLCRVDLFQGNKTPDSGRACGRGEQLPWLLRGRRVQLFKARRSTTAWRCAVCAATAWLSSAPSASTGHHARAGCARSRGPERAPEDGVSTETSFEVDSPDSDSHLDSRCFRVSPDPRFCGNIVRVDSPDSDSHIDSRVSAFPGPAFLRICGTSFKWIRRTAIRTSIAAFPRFPGPAFLRKHGSSGFAGQRFAPR